MAKQSTDRIAKEGANFTDWYGQQSCTAGRACFMAKLEQNKQALAAASK